MRKPIIVTIILIVIISTTGISQTMTGPYTIGGTSPDFVTINAAIAKLNQSVVTGAIIFNIRPGTYNEQLNLRSFVATNSSFTVTFQAANEIVDSVIIRYPGSTVDSTAHAVLLNTATNYMFNNITIDARKAGSSTKSFGIRFANHADHNTVQNCIVKASTYCIITGNVTGATLTTPSASNCLFLNNTIIGGTVGMYLATAAAQIADTADRIVGNKFIGQTSYGLFTDNNYLKEVSGNTFNLQDLGSVGILLQNCTSDLKLTENLVMNAQQMGIRLLVIKGVSAGVIVANNIVTGDFGTSGPFSTYAGIDIEGACDKLNIYHNTVNYKGPKTIGSAFTITGGTNIQVKNNIFSNVSGGYAYNVTSTSAVTASDNNIFFTTGAALVYWGAAKATLADLRTASGKDVNSLSVFPSFKSDYDLHTNSPDIDDKGTPIPGVTKDFDGNQRSVTAPDPGAYEYIVRLYDVGILAAGPAIPVMDTNIVVMTLRNEGIKSLVGKNAYFSFSVDSGKTWIAPEAFILAGLDSFFTISSYQFRTPWIVTKQKTYQLSIRLDSATLIGDANQFNDTIHLEPSCVGLGGSYTIGAGSAQTDFPTIAIALGVLYSCGAGKDVVFNLLPGTFNERVTITDFKRSLPSNTLTLRSSTGKAEDAVVTSDGGGAVNDHHTIRLSNVRHVTIENLTIENTNADFASAIHITNFADSNTIRNCSINVHSTPNTDSVCGIALCSENTIEFDYNVRNKRWGSFNVIEGNTITGGSRGVYLRTGIDPSNASDEGDKVRHNNIIGSFHNGILVTGIANCVVEGNTISMNKINQDGRGIQIGGHWYSGQLLSGSSGDSVRIVGNTVLDAGQYGIIIGSCSTYTKSGRILVANNMISGEFPSQYPTGLNVDYSRKVRVAYNAIYYNKADANPLYPSAAIYIGYFSDSIEVFNNIAHNAGGGFAINYGNATIGNGTIAADHNNWYTTGDTLAYWVKKRATLEELQTASHKDSNSISHKTEFLSPNNLHTFDTALVGKALPLAAVPLDLDGDLRDTVASDIGADEFILVDIGISAVEPAVARIGDNIVSATLTSLGALSLKDSTVTLSYSSDNGTSWSAPETFIATALTAAFTTEKFTFTKKWHIDSSKIYTLILRVNHPGLLADHNKANDSASISVCVGSNGGTFTVGGIAPDFATLTSAVEFLKNAPCGFFGPIVFNIRPGTYPERISIPVLNGSSSVARVTFQSETGNASDVVITRDKDSTRSNQYTIQLNGASYLTLKNLTIVNMASAFASGVHLTHNATSDSIIGCIVNMDSVSEDSSIVGILSSSATSMTTGDVDASATVVMNNVVRGGDYGIRLLGPNTAGHDRDNIIRGNTITNVFAGGIALESNDVLEVNYNRVTMRSTAERGIGIALRYVKSNYTVLANTITNAGTTGLFLDNASAITHAIVANNMIGGGFHTLDTNAGIVLEYCDSVNVYYNSVNFDGHSPTGRALFLKGGTNVKFVNNIFSAPGGGIAYYIKTPSSVSRSNNNDYYSSSIPLAVWGSVGENSLSDLQVDDGDDLKSVSTDPKFISAKNLHTVNRSLDGKAAPLQELSNDIDGEMRNATKPDIGADEFMPVISVEDVSRSNDALWLGQNYPNPFSGSSVVSYQLPEDVAEGTFELCDMLGRVVRRMSIDNSHSQIVFDALTLMPGAYHYSIITAGSHISKSMIVVR